MQPYHHPSDHGRKTVVVDLASTKWFLLMFAFLFSMAVLNLALLVWIISSLQLGPNGIGDGDLHLIKKGLSAKTDIYVDQLRAQLIQATSSGDPLIIGSNGDVLSIESDLNQFTLTERDLNIQASRFTVKAEDNAVVFDVDSEQLSTTASGPLVRPVMGGHKMSEYLATSHVQGSLHHDLRIESRTAALDARADDQLIVESQAGDQLINAYEDIVLSAPSIHFDTRKLDLLGLPHVEGHRAVGSKHHGQPPPLADHRGHQLCACGQSGRLFSVPADQLCVADELCSSASHEQVPN